MRFLCVHLVRNLIDILPNKRHLLMLLVRDLNLFSVVVYLGVRHKFCDQINETKDLTRPKKVFSEIIVSCH